MTVNGDTMGAVAILHIAAQLHLTRSTVETTNFPLVSNTAHVPLAELHTGIGSTAARRQHNSLCLDGIDGPLIIESFFRRVE
jgi:hypothetical protein